MEVGEMQEDVSEPSILMDAKENKHKRTMISRPGFGKSGRPISLLANYFGVTVKNLDQTFYQYSVFIKSGEGNVIEDKQIGRKIIDKLCQSYSSELGGIRYAYDGEKNLYTVGPLPEDNFNITVILEDVVAKLGNSLHAESPTECTKRAKCSLQSQTFTVGISYAAKIPLKSVSLALQGTESEEFSDALRVFNVVLRQYAANRGCLLVRQSFFHDDSRFFSDVGGGISSCRGFHSSFRQTHGGLSLNMDVTTTMILTPGPVIDFLLANQDAKEPRFIDWAKAGMMLKNMRVKATHSNRKYKIVGLSEKDCNELVFSMKVKDGCGNHNEDETREITVYDYFTKILKVELLPSSAYMPCIVAKSKRPAYLPIELCSLISLQRYTKALSLTQRAMFLEKSRQKPPEKSRVILDAKKNYSYDNEPLLSACGISIDDQFSQVNGRVLEIPKLKVGNNEDCLISNGRWNFKNKKVFNPSKIERWAVVNFSSGCDTSYLSRELISCGMKMGIHIERPFSLIEEERQSKKLRPVERVKNMFKQILPKFSGGAQFLLCVLPERKNSELYGPWKRMSLCECKPGVITQCVSPIKITDQYLRNVLLKINAKLGGINSLLSIERPSRISFVKDTPTMILGMDVSHGSPGRADVPSIAAVVGSKSWPLISQYGAAVRSQSPKVEMIESLYKLTEDGKDDGIMRELLVDFYCTSNARKPAQIIVFRDGVSESQFSQVLDIELNQMIKAYEYLGELDLPKFTVIVAQKNHHTKFFQDGSPENVPPGTVIDTGVVHPRSYDFYMVAQPGMFGTSRPIHYHVLLDEIGFSPDELQQLILSLSYVYQRGSCATSLVAPIRYAHLAAHQMGQFIDYEDVAATSAEDSANGIKPAIPEIPALVDNVASSMFFC